MELVFYAMLNKEGKVTNHVSFDPEYDYSLSCQREEVLDSNANYVNHQENFSFTFGITREKNKIYQKSSDFVKYLKKNYFSETIQSLNVIIGQNASGKSFLINRLAYYLSGSINKVNLNDYYDQHNLALFRCNGNIYKLLLNEFKIESLEFILENNIESLKRNKADIPNYYFFENRSIANYNNGNNSWSTWSIIYFPIIKIDDELFNPFSKGITNDVSGLYDFGIRNLINSVQNKLNLNQPNISHVINYPTQALNILENERLLDLVNIVTNKKFSHHIFENKNFYLKLDRNSFWIFIEMLSNKNNSPKDQEDNSLSNRMQLIEINEESLKKYISILEELEKSSNIDDYKKYLIVLYYFYVVYDYFTILNNSNDEFRLVLDILSLNIREYNSLDDLKEALINKFQITHDTHGENINNNLSNNLNCFCELLNFKRDNTTSIKINSELFNPFRLFVESANLIRLSLSGIFSVFSVPSLSKGEKQFVNIFTNLLKPFEYPDGQKILRFLSTNRENEGVKKTVLILLDEPDSGFHPKMSQEFIYNLNAYLEWLGGEFNVNFQVVITTHSPFMLSDLPPWMVLVAEGKEDGSYPNFVRPQENTFGASIPSLFRHQFYLDDYFTGKLFYENFMKYYRINLSNDVEGKSDVEMFGKLIADPFFRHALLTNFIKLKGE